MQLKRAKIINYRSLKDVTIDFGSHTALIGTNGAGKSSILKALAQFYSTSGRLDKDDYFGRDQSLPVEIELTFGELNEEERVLFESRVRDGELVVTRVFDGSPSSGRYYGSVLQNRDFREIRSQTTATPKRAAYRQLKETDQKYAVLPAAGSAAAVDEALAEWEANNPDDLTLERDDGQFFGFQNASRGALQRHTKIVFVPAVREASSDAVDTRNSPIGQLLEVLVRSTISQRADVQELQREITTRYRDIVSPENMPELGRLADNLTNELQELYSDAAVGLNWREADEIPIPLPAADVTLSDDGFGGPVDRQGHGLQRAFVLTLLQHLARTAAVPEGPMGDEGDGDEEARPVSIPNLILAIEEPELYQHPTKQRHLASVLRRLSSGVLPGAAGTTQVVFATHSPMFVSLTNADDIRFATRIAVEGSEHKQSELQALDLGEVARKLERANGKPVGTYTAETLKPRLHILGADLAEGFFASGVVLVEGRSDRAAILAIAELMGANFGAAGIAILSVEGKNNLDRPHVIFRELGIPVYAVWDCDCGTGKYRRATNLALNRLVSGNMDLADPNEETEVGHSWAHFRVKLENTIRDEITPEAFEQYLAAACALYEYEPNGEAQKIPDVMRELLRLARVEGRTSETLENLVRAIWRYFRNQELH